jgi:hypothetical protein
MHAKASHSLAHSLTDACTLPVHIRATLLDHTETQEMRIAHGSAYKGFSHSDKRVGVL